MKAAPYMNNREVGTASHLQFEILVTDISARFLSMLPQDVDREIEGALGKILQFFDADMCVLWRVDPERLSAVLTHFRATDAIPVIPEKFDYGPVAPWVTRRAVRGEVILVNSLDEFPEEAVLDRQINASLGIQALLILPVQIGGTVRHALQLVFTREGPAWLSERIRATTHP